MKILKSHKGHRFNLILLVWSLLIALSCGSDNGVTRGGNAPPVVDHYPTFSYNPVVYYTVTDDFKEFKELVIRGQFVYPSSGWIDYNMTEYEVEKTEDFCLRFSTCTTFDYNRISVFTRINDDNSIIHPNGKYDRAIERSYEAIQKRLYDIINDAVEYRYLNTAEIGYRGVGGFRIKAKDGNYYDIDLNRPLIVNPVYFYNPNKNYGYSLKSIMR